MYDRNFEKVKSFLKLFIENEKIHKIVLGVVFVFSSISISMMIAEFCHDTHTDAAMVLFINLIWASFLLLFSVIYVMKMGFRHFVFAVVIYFVGEIMIGNMLFPVYGDISFLPITSKIGVSIVFVIAIIYMYLKKFFTEDKILDLTEKISEFKLSIFGVLFAYFFSAYGLVLGDIVTIANIIESGKSIIIIKIILTIISSLFLLLSLPICIVYFKFNRIFIEIVLFFVMTVCAYILGALEGFGSEVERITTSFWYELLKSLNLII